MSLAKRLALLPADQQQALLASLSERDAEELLFRWDFWARPAQLPPAGDWRIWLILSGRGFGKTRTGAEWVRSIACGPTPLAPGQCRRIAIVGETAADCRDVLAKGDSGILAVHPKDFRPVYKPSTRSLVWPNGAQAFFYNGTEPDQLRGPQHDAALVDELCLAAGTTISTLSGPKMIEAVQPGDLVLTRDGYHAVVHSGKTQELARVVKITMLDGRFIVATPNHPIYVHGREFIPANEVNIGDVLWCLRSRNGMGRSGTAKTETTLRTERGSFSTDSFTKAFMGLLLRAFKSITGMKIAPIGASTTLKRSPLRSIWRGTIPEGSPHGTERQGAQTHLKLCGEDESPISVRASAAESSSHLSQCESPSGVVVAASLRRIVMRIRNTCSLWPREARSGMSPGRPERALSRTSRVLCAENHSDRSEQRPSAAQKNVVVSIEPLKDLVPVFNLEVGGVNEYFANGVLVHNCKYRYSKECWDQLQFGLRLGEHPQQVITTTPRPIPIIRDLIAESHEEDSGVVVTRGSTFENRANLAPSFLVAVEQRYGGSRLGRQELDGELLDDVPGALWSRQTLDAHRRKLNDKHPAMRRIIVAIDPAAKASSDSDSSSETGIIVAGHGEDGRGYLIDDRSCRLGPNGWAAVACSSYDYYEADAIVAEINQGGDMVESVIKAVNPRIKVIKVRATRGKTLRAEPISALYAQGKISHIGSFPALEDQMMQFTPFGIEGDGAADRVDALVWAFTELFPSLIGKIEQKSKPSTGFVGNSNRSSVTGY